MSKIETLDQAKAEVLKLMALGEKYELTVAETYDSVRQSLRDEAKLAKVENRTDHLDQITLVRIALADMREQILQ